MNIKEFIEKLGFTGNLFIYEKEYKLHNYTITIDIEKGKISYRSDNKTTVERQEDGQIQLGDHTTSYFDLSKEPNYQECFVVLECVDRLLEKGYTPNDLHLERRWKVGHGASGGRADVNVYGKDEKTLLMIECKTWGDEFEKEKAKMEEHGGQLFTYLNQDKNAKFLVLYTSKFENNQFTYQNLIVQIKDRDEDLKKKPEQLEQENIKLYKYANNKGELFNVWKESFNKYFHFNGIFEEDANAYSPELKALKKKNLKNLEDSQGLFNKFAEILRHNNISDNANAFNRVLSLFLCKIVDEEITLDEISDTELLKLSEKEKEEYKKKTILRFQVKEDEEYENIIDRLQELYQIGMKKLNEDVVYFSEDELKKIIQLYPRQTPLERVVDIFYQLKYYTNNEFAFKEVHNKKLFVQNARVLVEVIKLFQNYRFWFTSKQQILGDFFELMLNHGVKQSEGQFFTPIPIVRYIILSLGFENIINEKIRKGDIEFLPKILDYACGAGHFLTESIEELQQIIKTIDTSDLSVKLKEKVENYLKGTHWAEKYIFGIEKDYRLARTSQIACYINGDGEANIIFGDGLEEHEALKLNKKKFDVVIANPPYSVEAFKNYLNIERTHFDLLAPGILTERSSQIEALFIERTKQVLADNGLAGIILPSSILSNTGIYTKAREILLKHFEIKAITELGSKTFIATGTTTVILFLKRRNDDFLKDRNYIVSDYFNHTNYEIYYRYINAAQFLKMFVEHRGFDLEDYKRFLIIEINDNLAKTDMFKEYRNAFDKTTEIKQLQTKSYFMNYTKNEKEKELNKRFYEYCKEIEKEKFLYFMLCLGDGNKNIRTMDKYYTFQQTVIVKTGKEIDEQKEYLGYEFVGRKGQEGIKIYNAGGKMFDENNYENPEKANSYIRKTIQNIDITEVSQTQQNHVAIHSLVDLLDFNRVEFEKQINLSAKAKTNIKSKWRLVRLENLLDILESGNRPVGGVANYKEGVPSLGGEHIGTNGKLNLENIKYVPFEYFKNTNRGIIEPKDILICKDGALTGKVAYVPHPMPFEKAMINEHVFRLVSNEQKILQKYLFCFLFSNSGQVILKANITGQAQGGLNSTNLLNISIPLPPEDIQESIVKEIEQIEEKEKSCLLQIENINQTIKFEYDNVVNSTDKYEKLENIAKDLFAGGDAPKDNFSLTKTDTFNVPVYSNGIKDKGLYGYTDIPKVTEPCITISARGTLGYTEVRTEPFVPIVRLIVLVPNELVDIKYLKIAASSLNFINSGSVIPQLTVPKVKNLEIPLPSIDEQKKLIAIIEKKEKEIEKLKESLATVNSEKEEVLKKYL